ncbi:MAG: hypothetical protein HUJ55_06565 [Ileibacterium sp.]|nr:hypothetical protein [Ileibacterium sp.]
MKIRFKDTKGNDVTYELIESEASLELTRMLPMTVEIQDFHSNEKGFWCPKKLNVFGAPLAPGGLESLCYFKPWNQIVLFYGGYSEYEDLYELGMPVAGQGQVRNLKGQVTIEKIF